MIWEVWVYPLRETVLGLYLDERSTGKYQHEVEEVPKTECLYFPVLPDLSQGTDIIKFIKGMKLSS